MSMMYCMFSEYTSFIFMLPDIFISRVRPSMPICMFMNRSVSMEVRPLLFSVAALRAVMASLSGAACTWVYWMTPPCTQQPFSSTW